MWTSHNELCAINLCSSAYIHTYRVQLHTATRHLLCLCFPCVCPYPPSHRRHGPGFEKTTINSQHNPKNASAATHPRALRQNTADRGSGDSEETRPHQNKHCNGRSGPKQPQRQPATRKKICNSNAENNKEAPSSRTGLLMYVCTFSRPEPPPRRKSKANPTPPICFYMPTRWMRAGCCHCHTSSCLAPLQKNARANTERRLRPEG